MKQLIYLLFLFTSVLYGQVKAFPSAFGAGKNITGGRGGKVLHVTTLEDTRLPGSFTWALTQRYPRIIVFDVSGIINIRTSDLQLKGLNIGNCTIAGQTAPEGGITITGGRIWFNDTENVIVRYIKFRNGHNTGGGDCLTLSRTTKVMVDHCSFSYALDEALSTAGDVTPPATEITIQNNLFGECKTAMLVGADHKGKYGTVSVLRNATANVGWRFPKAGGNVKLEVINNVHHNWRNRTVRMDADNYTINLIKSFTYYLDQ